MASIEKTGKEQAEDPKIAVVVIHGMGEQKPMQTLRSFVECAWQRDTLGKLIEPAVCLGDIPECCVDPSSAHYS